MIDSFLYLIISRPNIMFTVCLYAHFQASPKDLHLSVVKSILIYLFGTPQMGLWYPKGADCDLFGTPTLILLGQNWIGKVPVVRVTYLGTCLIPSIA